MYGGSAAIYDYLEAMRDAGLATRVIPDFMPGRDRVVGIAAS